MIDIFILLLSNGRAFTFDKFKDKIKSYYDVLIEYID